MKKRHEMVGSHAMGRAMHVWCYGHFGMPIIVFPSAAGFAHEWEAQGMIDVLRPLINGGKIKLYCPESNVSQSWTNKHAALNYRMDQHARYESFIVQELVPLIQADCGNNNLPITSTGCSLGGFYAANFALKYPEVFRHALAMSGRYMTTHFTSGQSNQEVYFNNPLAYVSNLEGIHLERVAHNTHLTLVCGKGPFEEGCIEETIELGTLLKAKGIPATIDIWGHDSKHDWNWWHRQALMHLNARFG